jgi:uncharacterized repeat protein (TIGR03803 family)
MACLQQPQGPAINCVRFGCTVLAVENDEESTRGVREDGMLKPLQSQGAAPFALGLCVTLFATQPMLGQTFNVIHTFDAPQGTGPVGTLAIDATGNLYGATESGGAHGQGTVFMLHPAHGTWTLNVLHSFFAQENGDGSQPEAGPTVGPDGVVYGTTVAGGLGFGTVYAVSPPANVAASAIQAWNEAPIHSFTGYADGSQPSVGSLLLDSQGNLYGVTPLGGSSSFGGGVLYELSRSGGTWNENVLYNFCSELDCLDGGYPYAGPMSDAAGNLYGTVTQFALNQCSAAYKYPPELGYQLLVESLNGCVPLGSLIFDQVGNLYGTTFGGGGTVFELTQFGGQWNLSTLYGFAGGDNNTGPLGGLLFDASGNLWGTTNGDGAHGFGNIFKLTPSQGSWIYTDVYDFTGGNDGGNPTGSLIADGSGNMYGTAMTGGVHGSGVVFEITP